MASISPDQQPLLHFPCDFTIKIFGAASPEFEISAITTIRQFVPDLRENAIRTRESKDGKYLALTITVMVTSKKQLDDIYHDLSKNPNVIMAL